MDPQFLLTSKDLTLMDRVKKLLEIHSSLQDSSEEREGKQVLAAHRSEAAANPSAWRELLKTQAHERAKLANMEMIVAEASAQVAEMEARCQSYLRQAIRLRVFAGPAAAESWLQLILTERSKIQLFKEQRKILVRTLQQYRTAIEEVDRSVGAAVEEWEQARTSAERQ